MAAASVTSVWVKPGLVASQATTEQPHLERRWAIDTGRARAMGEIRHGPPSVPRTASSPRRWSAGYVTVHTSNSSTVNDGFVRVRKVHHEAH